MLPRRAPPCSGSLGLWEHCQAQPYLIHLVRIVVHPAHLSVDVVRQSCASANRSLGYKPKELFFAWLLITSCLPPIQQQRVTR
jgi:hypothetical protein